MISILSIKCFTDYDCQNNNDFIYFYIIKEYSSTIFLKCNVLNNKVKNLVKDGAWINITTTRFFIHGFLTWNESYSESFLSIPNIG